MEKHGLKRAVLAGGVVALLLVLASGSALAHKNNTSSAIGFSANPATDGDIVTITATVTYTGTQASGSDTGHGLSPSNGNPVVGDNVQIQRLELAGFPVACGTAGASFVAFANAATDGSGQFSAPFDTAGFGGSTICFRAHHPDGGGAHGNGVSASLGVDLVIAIPPACTQGVNVGATLASGNGIPNPGDSGPWTFAISVENCTGVDLTGVKVQGGTSGWTNYVDYLTSDGSTAILKSMPKKTRVLTWIVDIADGATKTIEVTVKGTVPSSALDGQILFISGPWSAVFNDGSGPQKSVYSGRVSLEVYVP